MTVIFAVVIALAAVSSLGVVLSRQTIYSALSLVVTVSMLAVLFLLLNAQFLFAVQLIIYAGAVMVLFIFIIALLSPDAEDLPAFDYRAMIALAGVVATTVLVFLAARNGVTYNSQGFRAIALLGACQTQQAAHAACDPYRTFAFPPDAVNAAGNVQTVAGQLFTTFLFPFEITSLLLLVAAIGAVYLTRHEQRRRP
jgi:NADH-quinone oxidoreductase subunit J